MIRLNHHLLSGILQIDFACLSSLDFLSAVYHTHSIMPVPSKGELESNMYSYLVQIEYPELVSRSFTHWD